MKNLFLIIALGLMAMSLTLTAEAKTMLKRVEVEAAPEKGVAMALETYDGEFFDLAEFNAMKKYRGNIKTIMDTPTLKLNSGEEIAVNGIRYFFIANKKVKMPKNPSFKLPPPEKRPSDDN